MHSGNILINYAVEEHLINSVLIRLEIDKRILCWMYKLLRLETKVIRCLGVCHGHRAPRHPLGMVRSFGPIQGVYLEELDKLPLRVTQVET